MLVCHDNYNDVNIPFVGAAV